MAVRGALHYSASSEWKGSVRNTHAVKINNLERQNLEGKSGDREGEAGQDTDAPSEQSDNLPSVYKTRVKQYTTNPYFEAGTEVFVRDWQNTVVRVVIRDSRLREADPILGMVSVRLSEVFAQASSVTQTYAITEGVGFGKYVAQLARLKATVTDRAQSEHFFCFSRDANNSSA